MRFRFAQTIGLEKLQTAVNPAGGLPEKLDFESRVRDQVRVFGSGETVAIGHRWLPDAYVQSLGVPAMVDIAELIVEVEAETFEKGFEKAGAVFDRLLDVLMFALQAPIQLGQLRAFDSSPPLVEGEERAFWTFSGYPFDRYARNVALETATTESHLTLPEELPRLSTAGQAALRWYTKSLETAYSHDSFMFLWIALESLVDASGLAVAAPYRADCGHEIPECPICGETTSRKVRGSTLRQFLMDHGVSDEDAKALWRLRQMMHGAVPFNSEKLSRLAELLQVLSAVVAGLLKKELGIALDAAPIVVAGQLAIHPAMGVAGTTRLSGEDAAELAA
jgi:hypothetical protein